MRSRDWERGIIALGIVLLMLPAAIRVLDRQPLVPGSEGYGHLRMAEHIAAQGIPAADPAMPERPYAFNLFDLVLAVFVKLFGSAAAVLLPFLLGIGALWCMVVLVRRWKLSSMLALGMEAVFVLSPFFVDAFTQPVPRALELFLLLLLLVVLTPASGKGAAAVIAARSGAALVLGGALATFGIIPAVIAFLLPLLIRTVNRRVPAETMSASLAAFLGLVAVALPAFLQTARPPFGRGMPVVLAISDLSGAAGMSVFAWLLALIGLVVLWRFKKRYYAMMVAVTAMLVVAFMAPSALVASHVLVSVLAGSALASLAQMRWAFGDIRALTLLVLACGLLFSTLAHGMALAQGPPTREFSEAAKAISSLLPRNMTLLTHPDDGFWLAYWSGRQVFLDGWAARTPRVDERWAAAQSIWHAQDIARVRLLLFKNKIGAVAITAEMRDGKVWELPEQELLFLLRNNETFKNVYRSASVDIWAVVPGLTP